MSRAFHLDSRHLTYWRSAAGPLAGWLGAPGSMPNCTMDRLEGAVAGQLQCLVRRRGALDWLIGHVGRIEFNDMSAGILNGK